MDELGHLRRNERQLDKRGLGDVALENADISLRSAESWVAVPEDQAWFEQLWIIGAIAALLSSSVMTYVAGNERDKDLYYGQKPVLSKREVVIVNHICTL